MIPTTIELFIFGQFVSSKPHAEAWPTGYGDDTILVIKLTLRLNRFTFIIVFMLRGE